MDDDEDWQMLNDGNSLHDPSGDARLKLLCLIKNKYRMHERTNKLSLSCVIYLLISLVLRF